MSTFIRRTEKFKFC